MDQLTKLLNGLSTRQRISIVLMALLTGVGIFSFSRWRTESDFRPLYTAMAPEDAAGVVQKLRETGVDYRLSENGGTVLVPSTKLAESRLALAAAGLPKSGRIGFELFDKNSFGATDFVEHINYKRALEGELERSVTSLGEVEQARVHLTLAKESIFLDKEQPAKASVVLKLRGRAQISQQNVLAITNLVANAVEGLSPDSVSIVDMDGNLLSRPRRAGDQDGTQATSEALEVRHQLERDLVAKIRTTLEPLIGPDRFRAGASVEFDLTSGEQQEETFDPTRSVMVSSQKSEDATDRAASSGGIPGTTANLPNSAPPVRTAAGGLSRRTESATYQTSRIVRHTRIPQGVVRRISLSVLVDHTVRWEGDGANRHPILEPPAPETLKTIKDLVAAATGFDAQRGDQLIVESLPFEISRNAEQPTQPATPAKPPNPAPQDPAWLVFVKNNRVIVGASAAGALVLMLALGSLLHRVRTRKRKRKLGLAVASPAALEQADSRAELSGEPLPALGLAASRMALESGEHAEVAERVRQFARGDAVVAANVIRLWLQESEAQTK